MGRLEDVGTAGSGINEEEEEEDYDMEREWIGWLGMVRREGLNI